MIPPPPTINSPLQQHHKKKRYQILSESNFSSENREENTNLISDISLQSFLHYGLDRNKTCFTLMDSDNVLTHSPTLVSFGGVGDLGFEWKIRVLDLEPKVKTTSFEYQWRTLKTKNGEIMQNRLFTCKNGNIHYSKGNQTLYIFANNETRISWIASLNLKTREWKVKNIGINHSNWHILQFALNFNDDYLVLSVGGIGSLCYLAKMKYHDIEQLLNDQKDDFLSIDLNEKDLIPVYKNLHVNQVAPIPRNEKVMIRSVLLSYIVDFEKNEIEKLEKCNNRNHKGNNFIYWKEEHGFTYFLICSESCFYKHNFQENESKLLKHSRPAIALENHLFFQPYLAKFNENRAVYIPNNDVLFILKLDYKTPRSAFSKSMRMMNFSDVIISLQ